MSCRSGTTVVTSHRLQRDRVPSTCMLLDQRCPRTPPRPARLTRR